MTKTYTLKTSQTSKESIDRLLKNIQNNARNDREAGEKVLVEANKLIADLISEDFESPVNKTIALTNAINSSVQALNQIGKANESLIKLASILQKFVQHTGSKDKEFDAGSLFDDLSKITGELKDQSDAQEEE